MSIIKRILLIFIFTLPVICKGAEQTTIKELAGIINGRIGELRDSGLFNEEFKSLMEMQREVNFIADPNSEKFPSEIITDQKVKKKAVKKLIQKIDWKTPAPPALSRPRPLTPCPGGFFVLLLQNNFPEAPHYGVNDGMYFSSDKGVTITFLVDQKSNDDYNE